MADELSPQAAGNGQPAPVPVCQCPNDAYQSSDSYVIDNSPTHPYHCLRTHQPRRAIQHRPYKGDGTKWNKTEQN